MNYIDITPEVKNFIKQNIYHVKNDIKTLLLIGEDTLSPYEYSNLIQVLKHSNIQVQDSWIYPSVKSVRVIKDDQDDNTIRSDAYDTLLTYGIDFYLDSQDIIPGIEVKNAVKNDPYFMSFDQWTYNLNKNVVRVQVLPILCDYDSTHITFEYRFYDESNIQVLYGQDTDLYKELGVYLPDIGYFFKKPLIEKQCGQILDRLITCVADASQSYISDDDLVDMLDVEDLE